MKIVWVSHSAWITGGSELGLSEAVKGLVAAGHEVHVVFPGLGELAELVVKLGATAIIVPHYEGWAYSGFTPNLHYRTRRLLQNLRRGWKLAAWLKQSRPDVVVSNTLGSPSGALAAKWARVPHVWFVHELFGADCHDQVFFDLGTPLSLYLMNKLSCHVIIHSAALRDNLKEGIPLAKLRLVSYGVAVPQLTLPVERTGGLFKLIIVGRIAPGKRQEDAIRATALLAGRGLNIHLSIVGNQRTSYGAFLKELVQQLQVENRITFVDFTPDPHSLVVASDVALMCSRGEAFGRVTVEAMKLGKPVIGAASAGTIELIQDGVNGLLYELGDAEGLSRCIETLYRDRELLERLGETARQWACAQFTPERYIADLLDVLEETRTNYEAQEAATGWWKGRLAR